MHLKLEKSNAEPMKTKKDIEGLTKAMNSR